ncbi:MAG: hypothetical protein RIS47_2010 [Bacteroidota bacterium]|jgi:DNA-binding MarR family transcriptional regulator
MQISELDSADVLKLDNQLCFAIYTSSRLMTRAYAPLLEKFGLTYPQYLVMLVLWEFPEMGVQQLGEKLFLDSGTLTPLLKRLESKDLVKRTRSGDDERKVLVTLTDAGLAMKADIVEVPVALYHKSCMSGGEISQLKSELASLIAKLSGLSKCAT